MDQVLIERQPHEPSLVKIVEPGSMEAYYNRKLSMVNGQTIDLSKSRQLFANVQQQVAELQDIPSLWVMMPSNVPETWTMLATLVNERAVGYRHHADYMLFYRFDKSAHTNPLKLSSTYSLRMSIMTSVCAIWANSFPNNPSSHQMIDSVLSSRWRP